MGMAAVDLIDQIYREKEKTVLIIEHRLEDETSKETSSKTLRFP